EAFARQAVEIEGAFDARALGHLFDADIARKGTAGRSAGYAGNGNRARAVEFDAGAGFECAKANARAARQFGEARTIIERDIECTGARQFAAFQNRKLAAEGQQLIALAEGQPRVKAARRVPFGKKT